MLELYCRALMLEYNLPNKVTFWSHDNDPGTNLVQCSRHWRNQGVRMKKIAIIVWLFPLSIVCGTVLPCPPCTGVHGMYICTDSTTCVRLIKDELEPARKIRLFTCAVTVRVHGWGDERLPLITDRHGKICHREYIFLFWYQPLLLHLIWSAKVLLLMNCKSWKAPWERLITWLK